jgi:hypothetical protein
VANTLLKFLLFIRLVGKCLDKKIVFVISDKKITILIITLDWVETYMTLNNTYVRFE